MRLYNTLTRQKDDFVPIDSDNVRMYVCGPTVYDFAHIGNARPIIVFDVLFRLLRHLYGKKHVTYVRNITDVDDKINARAAEEYPDLPLNEAIRQVTEKTERQFHDDIELLGCLPPSVEPRATEFVRRDDDMIDMVSLIETLIEQGNAYEAEGHVLFAVKSWTNDDGTPAYGGLSRRSLDDMIAGARVEVAPYKKDPMDFVLWKPSKAGEPAWESPWGNGRPGWHIECSAMSAAYLGTTFDIHGGGIDLVFPHHENEVAQSCCVFGTDRMANVWMHNGFLQVEGEKMSKSLGNFITIYDLLHTDKFGGRKWPGSVLRFAMLKTQYRQPIDWTVSGLTESQQIVEEWSKLVKDTPASLVPDSVIEVLSDDLNTPKVIAELHKLRKSGDVAALRGAMNFLGIGLVVPDTTGPEIDAGLKAQVEALIAARIEARKEKNWAEADRIRDELVAMRVVLMDGKDPETGEMVTTWEMAR